MAEEIRNESATAGADRPGDRPPVETSESPCGPGRAWHLGSLLVILILAGIAHAQTLSYELLGFDTLLQIDASRIEIGDPERAVPDLLGTFKETLTDGKIAAAFYRPLQNLSIALDYGIWKLDPWGYHLQSMLVYGLCILSVYLAARRLLGPASWFGPTLAALYFALHPILLHVVGFPCRRSETLVVTFLMLALWVLPIGRTGPGLRAFVAGIFVLLACGAKELGALGVGLIFLHQFLYADRVALGRRIADAALATVPAVTFFLAYIVNRYIVVEGLGGYKRPQFETYREKMREFLPDFARDLLLPWPLVPGVAAEMQVYAVGGALLAFAVIALLLALLFSARRPGNAGRATVLGLAVIAPVVPLLGMSQDYYPWYGVIPLAGLALLIAAIGELASAGWSAGGARRGLGLLVGLIAVAAVAGPLAVSPLLHEYGELRRGSELIAEELAQIDELMTTSPSGRTVELDLIPELPPIVDQNRPPLTNVSLLSLRGVRSLLALKYPDRRARATLYANSQKWRASPGEVLIKVRQIYPEGLEPDPEEQGGGD